MSIRSQKSSDEKIRTTKTMFDGMMIVMIGLAGGLAVGGGLVAFLTVLQVIPRLAQISGSYRLLPVYEGAVILGAVFWTFADFFHWKLYMTSWLAIVIGLLAGCFIGMLAAGLTEVLNVFPIFARRLKMGSILTWLLMAIVLGKITGSLFEWII